MTPPDPLADLAWLVDAGADEAVLDAPVNRFNAKNHPPLEGGSKFASSGSEKGISGRGPAPLPQPDPSQKTASRFPMIDSVRDLHPQAEGKKAA